jgi:carbon starvation protein
MNATATPATGRWTPRRIAIWAAVALLGAVAWGILALARGESVNAVWLIVAALCSYAIAYRFYARFNATRVLQVDDGRATPAERLDNDVDFQPTDRRVLFGHHFAAIAGAGPLVGPVLAAQMGYLPGTMWIIFGVIFAGAVQDMVILFFSMRRDGKSLGQMARDEIGPLGGAAALVAVFAIMIILLAVLALVVVNALADSPWGTFSLAMTIPIALIMASTCGCCGRAGCWRRPPSGSGCCWPRSCSAASSTTPAWPRRSPSRPRRWSSAWSSTGSRPRCFRCGCCWPPATTSRPS